MNFLCFITIFFCNTLLLSAYRFRMNSLSTSSPSSNLNLINSLKWRQALKRFKPLPEGYKVDITPILESIHLSPSSLGVQPYNIHIVTNQELKEKLRAVSYDQAQVTECSHLLVFCARNDPEETVNRMISSNNLETVANSYAKSMKGALELSKEEFLQWSTNQAHVALGVGVCAAAELRIGHCPMGGLVGKDVREVLGLGENEFPVCYLAIGSNLDEGTDKTGRIKYRLPMNELFKRHE